MSRQLLVIKMLVYRSFNDLVSLYLVYKLAVFVNQN